MQFDGSNDWRELAELVEGGAELVGIRSKPPLPKEFLQAVGDKLLAVGVFDAGTNHVDSSAASEAFVPVFNAEGQNARPVAELTFLQMMALSRGVFGHVESMRDGVWSKDTGEELLGKTVDVIGFGSIGREVSSMAESWGMKVLFSDPNVHSVPNNQTKAELDELLAKSDFVTIHTDMKGVISANEIALMKPGAYLINNARETCVDLGAVEAALDSDQLAGYATDVHTKDPSKRGDPIEHRFQGRDDVLLTPHIAGSTVEAQKRAGIFIADVFAGLNKNGTIGGTSINYAGVYLPLTSTEQSRILYLHRNKPGAMSSLTDPLTDAGMNTTAQLLQTKRNNGTALVGIEAPSAEVEDVLADADLAGRYRVINTAA